MTFYPDVLPKLLLDIREDDTVDALVHRRVRSPEPAPPSISTAGVVLDKGDSRAGTAADPYVAFVVLVPLPATRHPRVPIQFTRTAARCYGRTPAEAAELRWAVSNAIHNVGPRIYGNGLGIYQSLDDGGGEAETDPVTQQPYQTLVIEAPATTQVATA